MNSKTQILTFSRNIIFLVLRTVEYFKVYYLRPSSKQIFYHPGIYSIYFNINNKFLLYLSYQQATFYQALNKKSKMSKTDLPPQHHTTLPMV